MWVKLWDKEERKYKIIDDVDSVYWSTFRKSIDVTCGSKTTSYVLNVYDFVVVSNMEE